MAFGVHDPAHVALRGGLRTALVLPIVFAITNLWWDDRQAALVAAFGTIAFLVFADFGGPLRSRVPAYLGIAAAGFVLLPIGTLCSRTPALAAAAMAVVAFLVLYAGVIDGYVAGGGPAVLLAFVLAVMIPAGPDAIGARLAGWALACVAAIGAQLLLWPSRPQAPVRGAAAAACRALTALLRAPSDEAREAARAAVARVERAFAATPYRPSGPSGPTAATAQLVDDLDGVLPFTVMLEPDRWPAQRDATHAAAAAALDGCAERLASDGAGAAPIDLYALDAAHDAVGEAVRAGRASGAHLDRHAFGEAFRLQALADAVWGLGRHALIATGARAPTQRDYEEEAAMMGALTGTRQELVTHASMRSVWWRNSVRGAVALAAAVLVGQLTEAQNAYWIVLGTLAVLRSHALGTGSSIRDALLGTVAGIVAGGLLVAAIGAHDVILWILLPPVVFLAAWSPRAVSFLAGQAAFSLLVLILFNIVNPVGWRIGIVRIEDVAAGCAVSLAVGVVLWPRGAAAVVRQAVRASYDASAAYLAAAVELLQHRATLEHGRAAHRDALAAHDRLDTAFRQVLGELRAPTEMGLDALGTLVAGAARVRRTAHALTRTHALWPAETEADATPRATAARAALDVEATAVAAWLRDLARAYEDKLPPPAPEPYDGDRERRIVAWFGDADGSADGAGVVAWAGQHLEVLRRHEPRLAEAASRLEG